jgi:hypothetical protein
VRVIPRDRAVAERVLELDPRDPVRQRLEAIPAIAAEVRRVEAERFLRRHAGAGYTRRELVAQAARRVGVSPRTVWSWGPAAILASACSGNGATLSGKERHDMPEPGTGHATVEELKAAAGGQVRHAPREAEMQTMAQVYRARRAEGAAGDAAWAAAKAAVASNTPPIDVEALERVRSEVEARAAFEGGRAPVRD